MHCLGFIFDPENGPYKASEDFYTWHDCCLVVVTSLLGTLFAMPQTYPISIIPPLVCYTLLQFITILKYLFSFKSIPCVLSAAGTPSHGFRDLPRRLITSYPIVALARSEIKAPPLHGLFAEWLWLFVRVWSVGRGYIKDRGVNDGCALQGSTAS